MSTCNTNEGVHDSKMENVMNGEHLPGTGTSIPPDAAFKLGDTLFPIHSQLLSLHSTTMAEFLSIPGGEGQDVDVRTITIPESVSSSIKSVEIMLGVLYKPHSFTDLPEEYAVLVGVLELMRCLDVKDGGDFVRLRWDPLVGSKMKELGNSWGVVQLVALVSIYDDMFPQTRQ